MKKEMIIPAVVGLAVGISIMWFFGDKIKGMVHGFNPAPAKAK